MQHWRISACLDEAHTNNKKVFFTEANTVLPGLKSQKYSIDDLFEAILFERGRLKDMPQITLLSPHLASDSSCQTNVDLLHAFFMH